MIEDVMTIENIIQDRIMGTKGKGKIRSIEGLRTIGWIYIFICHFRMSFFPNKIWEIEYYIFSGNATVRLFFVISGLVLSYKYFTNERYDNILGDIIKRYFRLMPSILFSELMVYILMKFNCLRNTEVAQIVGSEEFLGVFNQFKPDIWGCLKEALFTTYFNGANGYIGPLWSMTYEYIGGILILSALSILKKSQWRWVFYAVIFMAFSSYYNYFILGMLICDLLVNTDAVDYLNKSFFPRISCLVIGCIMSSVIQLDDSKKCTRVIFSIGIILFMLGMLASNSMEKILGNRIMLAGGRIAYSAYLIHWPLIETLSCALILMLYKSRTLSAGLIWGVFVITFIAIIIISKFITDNIEPIGKKITKKLPLYVNFAKKLY